jgi:hypothetical protein
VTRANEEEQAVENGSNDDDGSEVEDCEDDGSSGDVDEGGRYPSIEEFASGSYGAPSPMARANEVEQQPRGSPLQRLIQNAQSAVSMVLNGFNGSPSGSASLPPQDLNQRFEGFNQNRRRSTRSRNQRKVFDPSTRR